MTRKACVQLRDITDGTRLADVDVSPSLATEEAAAILSRHRMAILRSALDPFQVARLRHDVVTEFTRLDSARAALSDEDRRLLDRSEMPVPGPDALRLRVQNYGILDAPRIRETLEAVAGPFLWHFPPMIRRHTNKDASLPYHQDWKYTLHYPRFFTCWTPLTACGVDAPTLELVPGPTDDDLLHAPNGVWEQGLPLDGVAALAAERGTIVPALDPGDVIMFSEHTLHRTYVTPTMTQRRLSVDFRAAPLTAISPEVRQRRKFVDPRRITHV